MMMTKEQMLEKAQKYIDGDNSIKLICLMNEYFELAPKNPSKQLLSERLRCLFEELGEIVESAINEDADGVVDGLCDNIIFAVGILYNLGIDVDKALTRVMSANLQKERGTKSTRPNSHGYDLVKPEGWEAPHHYDNLGKLEEIFGKNK